MMPDALLAFLYAISIGLVGVFAFNLYEVLRGWKARGRRPYLWLHHAWDVEILKRKVVWFTCRRCGAVGVRGERVR